MTLQCGRHVADVQIARNIGVWADCESWGGWVGWVRHGAVPSQVGGAARAGDEEVEGGWVPDTLL
jgi:hypothetical protein